MDVQLLLSLLCNQKQKTMTNAALQEPKNKLEKKGSSFLSDSELLSFILSGSEPLTKAKSLLEKVNYNYFNLSKMNIHELKKEGLSTVQSLKLIAIFEFSRRKETTATPEKIQIKCSTDIKNVMIPYLSHLVHEEFYCIYLNRCNKIVSIENLSKGGISGTVTDVRIIIKKGIELLASGVILCHNHPSGNMNPSESDTKITNKIKEACNIMDIQLLDHLIISEDQYFSFADNGVI